MDGYLYQHDRAIMYQWIPSHVRIRGNELLIRCTATISRGPSSLSTVALSRSDDKFIIKDTVRNPKRSLLASLDYRSETLFSKMNPEVELEMPSILKPSACNSSSSSRGWSIYISLGWNVLSLCNKCRVVDNISRTLLMCTRYSTESSDLSALLAFRKPPHCGATFNNKR